MNPLPAMPIACTQIKLLYAFILSAILDKSHEKKNVAQSHESHFGSVVGVIMGKRAL